MTSKAVPVDQLVRVSHYGNLEIIGIPVDVTSFQPECLFVPAVCPLYECMDDLLFMFETVPRNVMRYSSLTTLPPFQMGDILVSPPSYDNNDIKFVMEESLETILRDRAMVLEKKYRKNTLYVYVLRQKAPTALWNDPALYNSHSIAEGSFRLVRFHIASVPATLGAQLLTEQCPYHIVRTCGQVNKSFLHDDGIPQQYSHFENLQIKAIDLGLLSGDILLWRNDHNHKWKLGSSTDLKPKLKGSEPFNLIVMRLDAPKNEGVTNKAIVPESEEETDVSHLPTIDRCRVVKLQISENKPKYLGAKVKRKNAPGWFREIIRSGAIACPGDEYCFFSDILKGEYAESLGIKVGDVLLVLHDDKFRIGFRDDLLRMMQDKKSFSLFVLRRNKTCESNTSSNEESTMATDEQSMSLDEGPNSKSDAKRTLATESTPAKRRRRDNNDSGMEDTEMDEAMTEAVEETNQPNKGNAFGIASSGLASVVAATSDEPETTESTQVPTNEFNIKEREEEDAVIWDEMADIAPTHENCEEVLENKENPVPFQELQTEFSVSSPALKNRLFVRCVTLALAALLVVSAFGAFAWFGQKNLPLRSWKQLQVQSWPINWPDWTISQTILQESDVRKASRKPDEDGNDNYEVNDISELLSHADQLAEMILRYRVRQGHDTTGDYDGVLHSLRASSVQLCRDGSFTENTAGKCEKKLMRVHVMERLSNAAISSEEMPSGSEAETMMGASSSG
eukprot:scaffold360_cov192-Amphora_coffeaeformis.AAC.4